MAEVRKPRIIVAISGASGAVFGIEALKLLRGLGTFETHLVISPAGARTIGEETDLAPAEVEALADHRHAFRDIGSPLASGSFAVQGMLVAPCSARTLGGIAVSLGDNLIVRAADVCLKERRRLVLVTRETPLNLVHIRNMETVTLAGATVLPPVPAFYHRPKSIDDLLRHTVGKVLDQFGIDHHTFERWG